MNTTVNINLGGMAFIINEDAYKSLQQYIHSFEEKYDDKEIAKDIEFRLAELFTEYLSKLSRQVIEMSDVENAIKQIGEPTPEDQPDTEKAQPKKKKKFGELDKSLQELANLREENPEMPLKELGNLLSEKVGKSGVKYRLDKIHQFAEELKM